MTNREKTLEILTDLGLSENESKVYLSMLSLGSATIMSISKASGVKRTTVYNILEGLNEKGLSRVDIKGFKKLYVAENPNKLENILERKKDKLKNLFPELESLYNLKGGESFIKYYEGSESIKNLHFDLIDEIEHNADYLVIGDPDRWEDINKTFSKEFIKKRNKIKLNTRMILVSSDTAKKYKEFEKNFQEEIKLLPKDSKLETNLIITPSKIVIQQMISPIVAVTIENKSIIRMHTELFNIIWNTL